jgi:selenophosphate synthetase-related protein
MAVDLRGRYRPPYANWEAATDAPPHRLRGDLALLPEIAERGLSRAAKDISQGGVIGTAAMLAECSRVAITIDVTKIPVPAGVALDRWLSTFPSFGFLLAVAPGALPDIVATFTARGIAAADIGAISAGSSISITDGQDVEIIRDFRDAPLILATERELIP